MCSLWCNSDRSSLILKFELGGEACLAHSILLLSGFQCFQIVGYFTNIPSAFPGMPEKSLSLLKPSDLGRIIV